MKDPLVLSASIALSSTLLCELKHAEAIRNLVSEKLCQKIAFGLSNADVLLTEVTHQFEREYRLDLVVMSLPQYRELVAKIPKEGEQQG